MREWDRVIIAFPFPDEDSHRWVSVKGPIARVFRSGQTPFVELPYVEYDDHTDLAVSADFFSEEPKPEELLAAIGLTFELEALEKAMGIKPEGICAEGPVEINLSHIIIRGIELSRG